MRRRRDRYLEAILDNMQDEIHRLHREAREKSRLGLRAPATRTRIEEAIQTYCRREQIELTGLEVGSDALIYVRTQVPEESNLSLPELEALVANLRAK